MRRLHVVRHPGRGAVLPTFRDITYAVFCQGPYAESARYRDFMGWDMPWYSAQDSVGFLLSPPRRPGMMHLVCYVHDLGTTGP
jgi:hypothetical protein